MAFGGRDIAADLLRDARRKGSDAADRGRRDAELARDRVTSEYGQPAPRDEAATSDVGYSGEATQQMPPPTAPGNPTR